MNRIQKILLLTLLSIFKTTTTTSSSIKKERNRELAKEGRLRQKQFLQATQDMEITISPEQEALLQHVDARLQELDLLNQKTTNKQTRVLLSARIHYWKRKRILLQRGFGTRIKPSTWRHRHLIPTHLSPQISTVTEDELRMLLEQLPNE